MKSYKYLLVNGCSFVHGDQIYKDDIKEGLDRKWIGNEKRFSKLLSDRLDCREINLSMSGSSNDRIIRTTFEWIRRPFYNVENSPTCIVIGLTDWARFDFYSDEVNRYFPFNPFSIEFKGILYKLKDILLPRESRLTDSYLEKINDKYFNGVVDIEKFYTFMEIFTKYLVSEKAYIEKLNRDIIMLHTYCKFKNIDLIIFNSIGDFLTCKNEINYFSFGINEKHLDDSWRIYCYEQEKKLGVKLHSSDYFAGSHPGILSNLEMTEMLYKYIMENFNK
tara:strand:- start:1738 stop:2568 length:831 start_codon:yes stop_codon:yes gene_type:complete